MKKINKSRESAPSAAKAGRKPARGLKASNELIIEGEVLSAEDSESEEAVQDSVIQEPEVVEGEVLPEGQLDLSEDEDSSGEAGTESLGESVEEGVEVGAGKTKDETGRRALVRFDAVDAYLREIRAYPKLTREEERDLAVRYLSDKDLQAAYKLVTSNLWLVVKIARDYERAARGLLDLVQEGNIGLMEAVRNYDPYRGVRFPSYAVWWIKAYIIRYLIANWRLVKIGTTQAQRKLFFNLRKEKDRLEQEGFAPAPKLLAERLSVKESEIIEMEQRLSGSDMSVDAPFGSNDSGGGEGDASLLSVLPAPQANAEEVLEKKRSSELIRNGLAEFALTLKDKERVIFQERMLGEEKATLQDISEKVGVSRERVRQIENRLKERLREFLVERLGSALESMEF